MFRVEGSLSLGSGQTPGNDSDGEVPQASEDMADVFRRVWLLGDVFDMITGSPLVSASFVQSLACSEPPDPRAFHPNLRLLALNLVEVWFSIIECQAIHRGASVRDLIKICAFITGWNDRCRPRHPDHRRRWSISDARPGMRTPVAWASCSMATSRAGAGCLPSLLDPVRAGLFLVVLAAVKLPPEWPTTVACSTSTASRNATAGSRSGGERGRDQSTKSSRSPLGSVGEPARRYFRVGTRTMTLLARCGTAWSTGSAGHRA